MRPRPLAFSGVILCTCFSPSPLVQEKEPAQVVLVHDPPKYPSVDEIVQFQYFEDTALCDDTFSFLSIKPISWFLRKNISLCSVPTVPYGHGRVHKPPWGI